MQDPVALFGIAGAATVLLVSARIAGVILMTPMLRAIPLPFTARALLLLGLSTALAASLGTGAPANAWALGALPEAFLIELAIGATLGLGVLMALSGFALAGRLIDLQVGFGIGQVFDPATRSQQPVLTAVFGLLGLLLFLLLEGHHAILRGISVSLQSFPVGQPWALQASIGPILVQAGSLFALGFALAAPVVLGLLVVEFVLGVVARNLPQVNMLVLGIPVKIVAGLLLLSLWAGVMGEGAQRLHSGIYRGWTQLFEQAAARPGAQR